MLRNSSVELEINGLFSASSDTKVPNYDHKGLQASTYCNTPAKMVKIAIHENVLNSAVLVYFNVSFYTTNLKRWVSTYSQTDFNPS